MRQSFVFIPFQFNKQRFGGAHVAVLNPAGQTLNVLTVVLPVPVVQPQSSAATSTVEAGAALKRPYRRTVLLTLDTVSTVAQCIALCLILFLRISGWRK